jgi:hypothetical protein
MGTKKQGTEQDFPVGCTPGVHVPHDHAQTPVAAIPFLLAGHRAHDGTASESSLLDLPNGSKNQLPNHVVNTGSAANGSIVVTETLRRDAAEDGSCSLSLSGAVGRPNPVLVEASHSLQEPCAGHHCRTRENQPQAQVSGQLVWLDYDIFEEPVSQSRRGKPGNPGFYQQSD